MLIDKKLLDTVTSKAQRLLNALEPGTVLPIHRHRHTAETYIVLRDAIKNVINIKFIIG